MNLYDPEQNETTMKPLYKIFIAAYVFGIVATFGHAWHRAEKKENVMWQAIFFPFYWSCNLQEGR